MAQESDLTVLATDLQFPEGPVVMPDGDVLVVEIRRGTLSRVPAGGGTAEVVADLGGGPNGAAIGPDGAAYVVNNGGFKWSELDGMTLPFDMADMSNQPDDFAGGWVNRVDLDTGEHTVLYREGPDHRFAGPNDIVFDAQGGFWFTDFGKTRARDADRGSLFYATVDGKHIVEAARGLNGPNGVGPVTRAATACTSPRASPAASSHGTSTRREHVRIAGSDGRRGDEGPLRLPRRRSGRGRRGRRALPRRLRRRSRRLGARVRRDA